jgi:hypothetical protein
MKFKIFIISILIVSLYGCNGKTDKALLQNASGRAGEMIVVMDSAQWEGELGEEIRATFQAEIKGLPREEFMFKLNRVEPTKLNSVLRTVKNLVFVVTLDSRTPGSRTIKNYFTKDSQTKIKSDSSLFVYTATDEFAKGQNIMYLFGNEEKGLINNLKINRSQLQNYFNQAENNRLFAGLYKAKEMEGFRQVLIKDHQCELRIPFGYKMVLSEPGFAWFRQINDESDKDIFITYKDYTSESAFEKENIIRMRDSIASKQLFEDPANTDTHIKTETAVPYIPVISNQVSFNNKFAIETRGLWKTNNLSMGGPFIGYTLVDEALGRLYYIEGFVYSPGKSQREFMRELEVILSTFKVSSEIRSKNNAL